MPPGSTTHAELNPRRHTTTQCIGGHYDHELFSKVDHICASFSNLLTWIIPSQIDGLSESLWSHRTARMSSVEAFLGGQRHAVVTNDDHGPILQIAIWFLMVAMILMTLLRLAIRFAASRDLGLDDAICVLAMVSLEETPGVAGDG